MDENVESQREQKAPTSALAGGSIISAVGALVGASCCVLPIVLFNIGVGSAVIAQLGIFARLKDYFLGAALALLIAGVLAAYWNGRRPGRWAVMSFAASGAVILTAYFLPYFEADILRSLELAR